MTNTTKQQGTIASAAANLFPGYFALVMATGIISIASYFAELRSLAWTLFALNILAYLILWTFLLIRLIAFFPRVRADITDHVRGPGFFTVIAGTCLLGSQSIIIAGQYTAAGFLWLFGLVLWVLVMYTFFTSVTVRENKPPLEIGINGTWLIAAVSTQSISVLGTLLANRFSSYREPLLFFTLCMFLLGCMIYLLLITLIFYRFTFFGLTSTTLTPPYWINMGAVAITTLAGARLILASSDARLLTEILPFVKGFTIFFWAAGTWWIPLLFILGFWRHVYKRFPLVYDPQYWGMVFPLGMYTVCTFQLSKAINFEPLLLIPQYFFYIALAAWLVTSVAMIDSLLFKRFRH